MTTWRYDAATNTRISKMTPVMGSNNANAAIPAAGSSSIMTCSEPYGVEEIASGESPPSATGLDKRSCWSWSVIIGLPRKALLHRSENDGDIGCSPATCLITNSLTNLAYFLQNHDEPGQSLRSLRRSRAPGPASTAAPKPSLRNLDAFLRSIHSADRAPERRGQPTASGWSVPHQCSIGELVEPLDPLVDLVVDTTKRSRLGKVMPRVQPGHEA